MGGPVGIIRVNFSASSVIGAGGLLHHGDAILDGTHFHAEVAGHAFIVQHLEMALAILGLHNGLV